MGLVRSIAALFSRSRNGSTASVENASHALGRRGEKLAARYLRKQGCKVIYRNFRAPRGGEVDLVCRDGDTLVFVEIKTRSSEFFGRPAEAVNRDKQDLIKRGAFAWLRMLDNPEIPFRFDVLEIVLTGGKPDYNLICNAFQLDERSIF